MSDATYDLIFRGELLPDGDGTVARAELARVLKLDDTRLGQLFSGGTVYVRRNTDRETAVRFQAAFRHAGARLRVLPVEAGAAAVAPPAAVPVPAPPAASLATVAASAPTAESIRAAAAAPAPVRRTSLAERLAAQQAEAGGDDPSDTAPGTPITFVSEGGAVAPAVPPAAVRTAQVAAAAARPSPLDDAIVFTLAPLGADLIEEDERELKAEVLVSVEHIDLAPPGGSIPVLAPRADIRSTVVIPDFDVAEAGALMAELTEFVELPLDLSAFSVAPVGARIGEPQEAEVADVRVDHLTLAPPGADLSASPR